MSAPLALQLYSVRDALKADFISTLKKVAELGFSGVEFAGFYGFSAEEMKKLLEENNLIAMGSHTGLDLLENDLEGVMAYNKAIGNDRIICPWAELDTPEQLEELVQKLAVIGKTLKENGFTFYYHNHDGEFKLFDGKYAFDILLEQVPGLKAEVDVYWATVAGVSPVEYLKAHQDVTDLIHLKDGIGRKDTPVGEGEVDIQGVIDVSNEMKVKWLVVEDESTGDQIASVATGMKNLREKFTLK